MGLVLGMMMSMDPYDYDARMSRRSTLKVAELQKEQRLKHVIFADQFDRGLLEHLCGVADMIRTISKTKKGSLYLTDLLSHKRAMMYFTQPSTRTFLSFMAACQILGITCNEVRDRTTSSEVKGESPFDSIRMFSSYFDLIVMRSQEKTFAECCAYLMNDLEATGQRHVPIINGGSGSEEHPTQALLDIYTMTRTFQLADPKDSPKWSRYDELRKSYPDLSKGLDRKVYAFCGDIGRGRTVRSLCKLLTLYEGVTLIFIAPDIPSLKLSGDVRDALTTAGAKVIEVSSFEDHVNGKPVIEMIDCLYMTRIQREHNKQEDAELLATMDLSQYCLTMELVNRMKLFAPILHPFPRDSNFGEIPPEIDTNPRVMYFRQARNGMWVRAALIAYLFDVDGRILNHYREHYLNPTA